MPEDRKLRETLLLKEFDHRFQEKTLHMQRYHRQTDFLQLYVAVAVGLGGIAFAPATKALFDTSIVGIGALTVVFVLLAILLAEYLLFGIIDSWVIIFRNAHRLSAIELELNEMCGSVALRWDSVIAPEFYLPPSGGLAVLLRFDILSSVIVLLMLGLTAGSLLEITALVAPEYLGGVAAALCGFVLLNAYQFFRLYRNFLPELHARTLQLSERSKIEI